MLILACSKLSKNANLRARMQSLFLEEINGFLRKIGKLEKYVQQASFKRLEKHCPEIFSANRKISDRSLDAEDEGLMKKYEDEAVRLRDVLMAKPFVKTALEMPNPDGKGD